MPKIDWTQFETETEVSQAVEAGLKDHGNDHLGVHMFLFTEGLIAASTDNHRLIYAYADGQKSPDSPVEQEWLIEFYMDNGGLKKIEVSKHLVAP
jgi:hypothetical protein